MGFSPLSFLAWILRKAFSSDPARNQYGTPAALSQTTTGAKSFFLKVVDPFFTGKNAGTVLPIKIGGTKDHHEFRLDRGGKSTKNEPLSLTAGQ
jgi:hypothetical protein